MRLMIRKDVPIAILLFSAAYPDVSASIEVSRLYTTIDHVKRMIDVLSRNLATYEDGIKAQREKKS